MEGLLARLLDEAEARQLPALIAEWGERSDPLRWIARALQLDLPLLIERPGLVIPCLVRRTVGFDDAGAYYQREAMPGDATETCALVESLVSEWQPAGPWLRALRPQRYPLEAGVIEEYRDLANGGLRFSDDDELIGIVGAPNVWERATGRRVDQRFERRLQRWTVGDPEGGVLRKGELDLQLQLGQPLSSVCELDDGRLLVTCRSHHRMDDDYDYGYHLIDPTTATARWRVSGECRLARIVDQRLFTVEDSGCTIRSLATGEELARFSIWPARAAFSSRGLLATLDHNSIRVWDLDRLAKVPHGHVAGEVELSPDGTRALVGHTLVDAHDGRMIASLQLRSRTGWLEGGPPENCIGLVDGYVIQVMPFGTDIWRTGDGTRLMDSNRDLRGWPDDAVCYESHGRWFAIYFRRQREIHVFELPSGELRYTTSTKLDRHRDVDDVFRFSADGEQLWWRDEESQEWIVDTGNFAPPARFAGGPPMRRAEATRLTCVDGLLEIEGACAPVEDSTIVVTDGGRSFVGARDHYRLIR